ncbi:PAS domain S-box protein, partial [Brevundimonas sp. SPF441]|uniref:PAS domain S-box protein n=1 Tax=Brevundimonas sp. SPF441 TaxID=2663795 RepID=UPI00129DF1DA
MFGLGSKTRRAQQAVEAEIHSLAAAVDRSQAVIQFDLDGTVRDANRNFLSVIGYELGEIFGRHHR